MSKKLREARAYLRVLAVVVAALATLVAPLAAAPSAQAQLLPPPPPIDPAWGMLGGFGVPGLPFPGFGPPMGLGAPWAPPSTMLPGMPAVPARSDTQRRSSVTIQDNYFLPAEITIPVGTTVTWTNRGRVAHTVTDAGVWDSGRIPPGGTFSAVFAVAGTFDYVCTIHPEMQGRINVQVMAESTTPAPATTAPSRPSSSAPGGAGALLQQLTEAMNRGDTAAAMALFADDATLSGAGTCMTTACAGRDAVQREWQREATNHARIIPGQVQVTGNTATAQFQVTADDIRALGVERLIGLVTLEARNGQIASVRVTLDPGDPQNAQAMQRMAASGAAGAPSAAGTAGSTTTAPAAAPAGTTAPVAAAAATGAATAPPAPASAQAAAGAATTGAAAPAAPSAPATGQGGTTAMADLAASNNSGVNGHAMLTQTGSNTAVTVTLSGMAPGSAHAGMIHSGACSGPILFPLGTITADSAGQGSATATVNAPIDLSTWWVQYHASDNPPGPPIACGQPHAGGM
jgi:plastocyanin